MRCVRRLLRILGFVLLDRQAAFRLFQPRLVSVLGTSGYDGVFRRKRVPHLVGPIRSACAKSVPQPSAVTVVSYFSIVIPSQEVSPNQPSSRKASNTGDDDNFAVLLIGLAATILILGWAYVEARQVALLLTMGLVSVALGLSLGLLSLGRQNSLFGRDWEVVISILSVLAIATLVLAALNTSPIWKPLGFEDIINAYDAEGFAAFRLFDPMTTFLPIRRWAPSS